MLSRLLDAASCLLGEGGGGSSSIRTGGHGNRPFHRFLKKLLELSSVRDVSKAMQCERSDEGGKIII